jgi:hypothetical protein
MATLRRREALRARVTPWRRRRRTIDAPRLIRLALAVLVGRWPRIAIGAIGGALLVLGEIVAWRVRSAAPLVVPGTILFLIAVLPWRSLRTSHADATLLVELGRDLDDVAQDLDEVAADLPPGRERENVQQAIDEIRAAAGATTAAAAAAQSPNHAGTLLRALTEKPPLPLGQAPADPFPTHSIRRGSAALRLLNTSLVFRYVCSVTAPDGTTSSAVAQLRGQQPLGLPWVEVSYPRDFVSAAALRAGTYSVVWEQEFIVAVPAPMGVRTIATDEFVVAHREQS